MKELPRKGITHVQVMCPGFAADCLETIEEIQGLNQEEFRHAGGREFQYIPCLNDSPLFIQTLSQLVAENCQGWNQREIAAARAQSLAGTHRAQENCSPEAI